MPLSKCRVYHLKRGTHVNYVLGYIHEIRVCFLHVTDSSDVPRDTVVNVSLLPSPFAQKLCSWEQGEFTSRMCVPFRILLCIEITITTNKYLIFFCLLPHVVVIIRLGMAWMIGSIDALYTQFVTTGNHSAAANLVTTPYRSLSYTH
jgi:hypothetical protein